MIHEFEITCPECKGWIIIDLETGEVLRHGDKRDQQQKKKKKRKIDPKKFAEAMDRVKKREEGGDETFADAVRSVEKQKQRLEDAFEEAKKKAEENPDEKPPNPFDDLFT